MTARIERVPEHFDVPLQEVVFINDHLQRDRFRFILLGKHDKELKIPFEHFWTCETVEEMSVELKKKQTISAQTVNDAKRRAKEEVDSINKEQAIRRAKEAEEIAQYWQNYQEPEHLTNYHYDDPTLLDHIMRGGNYGVCTGVGDLLVFDADDLDRWRELGLLDLIPKTFTIESRPGHRHFYLMCPGRFKNDQLCDPKTGNHIGDLKAEGGWVVALGCRHPSGSVYTLVEDAPIAEVTGETLRQILRKFKLASSAAWWRRLASKISFAIFPRPRSFNDSFRKR